MEKQPPKGGCFSIDSPIPAGLPLTGGMGELALELSVGVIPHLKDGVAGIVIFIVDKNSVTRNFLRHMAPLGPSPGFQSAVRATDNMDVFIVCLWQTIKQEMA